MIAGIRTPFIDEIVEEVIKRYVEGNAIKDIHSDLAIQGVNVCQATLYHWVRKATMNGYADKVYIERVCIGGPI